MAQQEYVEGRLVALGSDPEAEPSFDHASTKLKFHTDWGFSNGKCREVLKETTILLPGCWMASCCWRPAGPDNPRGSGPCCSLASGCLKMTSHGIPDTVP